ncbi:Hypothetical protein CINCED_3A024741 [Cinara cedri]|uniref:Uncharacterized protein n=1 Tax=Cinara cedri TaxID=506608 RepID=A0A5E4MMQ2_9HEMI|nr:Hypothetical protein CINCED_3A024741 [Cinara cedri]
MLFMKRKVIRRVTSGVDDEANDEMTSLMSPPLICYASPPDLSTRRSLHELILISSSDLSDDHSDDHSSYSSSSPPLCPTNERGLDTPMNVTGPLEYRSKCVIVVQCSVVKFVQHDLLAIRLSIRAIQPGVAIMYIKFPSVSYLPNFPSTKVAAFTCEVCPSIF